MFSVRFGTGLRLRYRLRARTTNRMISNTKPPISHISKIDIACLPFCLTWCPFDYPACFSSLRPAGARMPHCCVPFGCDILSTAARTTLVYPLTHGTH